MRVARGRSRRLLLAFCFPQPSLELITQSPTAYNVAGRDHISSCDPYTDRESGSRSRLTRGGFARSAEQTFGACKGASPACRVDDLRLTKKQEVKSNKEKTKELAVQATRWLDMIVKELNELKLKDHSALESLRPNMEEILKCATSPTLSASHDLVCSALNAIVEFAAHSAKRGAIVRTIRKSKDEEKLSKMRNTLQEAFERFKVCRISSSDYAKTQWMPPSGGVSHSHGKGYQHRSHDHPRHTHDHRHHSRNQ
jgi:hypothetical protein